MDRTLGGVSLLTLSVSSTGSASRMPSWGTQPADLDRRAATQNLLVILHEVENRLQEEREVVEAISSQLQAHAIPAPSPALARRTVRSIWSDARALPELEDEDAVKGAKGARVAGVSGSGGCGACGVAAAGVAAGCGDWCESPAKQNAVQRVQAADFSGGRPSWLAGNSYKYFLGKPGEPDRPHWLSQAAGALGLPARPPLCPSYQPPLRPPLVGAPQAESLPASWTQSRDHQDCVAVSRPTTRKSSVTCPEYRRAQLGARCPARLKQDTVEDSFRLAPPPTLAPMTGDCEELQEVYKNERVSPLGASATSGSSDVDLESELPRGPTSTPVTASSPDPATQCCDQTQRLLYGGQVGGQDSSWLVDAVLLLKEYYLKRAQLCLQTNIAASCHQLAVPERDVCHSAISARCGTTPCRDVGVGDALATTNDGWVSTDSLHPRSADAATSPRPAPRPTSSRTTQTPPVLCEPINRCGDYQWVTTDMLRPDLSILVSCFSDDVGGEPP